MQQGNRLDSAGTLSVGGAGRYRPVPAGRGEFAFQDVFMSSAWAASCWSMRDDRWRRGAAARAGARSHFGGRWEAQRGAVHPGSSLGVTSATLAEAASGGGRVTLAVVERQPDIASGLPGPPLAMSRAQAEIHDLVARPVRQHVRRPFMPMRRSRILPLRRSVDEMVAALDQSWRATDPFEDVNRGMIRFGKSGGPVLDIQHLADRTTNPAMQALHEGIFTAVRPADPPDANSPPV